MNLRPFIGCSLICLTLLGQGCAGGTLIGPVHASGAYSPTLPTPEMYEAPALRVPETGSLVTIGGVRVRGSSAVLVDFLVVSRSETDCRTTAQALEDLAKWGESPPFACLIPAGGRPISMIDWRSAVLKNHPEVGAFAILHAAAIADLADSTGAHRRSVTFSYEVDGSTAWPGTTIASIDAKRLSHALQRLDWMKSFNPGTVRIDADPRSVPVVMVP